MRLTDLDGSSYAFSVLNLAGGDEPVLEEPIQDLKDAEGVSDLQTYDHLQHINLAKNEIRDISILCHFPHLLTIDASSNQISSISFLDEYSSHLQFL